MREVRTDFCSELLFVATGQGGTVGADRSRRLCVGRLEEVIGWEKSEELEREMKMYLIHLSASHNNC